MHLCLHFLTTNQFAHKPLEEGALVHKVNPARKTHCRCPVFKFTDESSQHDLVSFAVFGKHFPCLQRLGESAVDQFLHSVQCSNPSALGLLSLGQLNLSIGFRSIPELLVRLLPRPLGINHASPLKPSSINMGVRQSVEYPSSKDACTMTRPSEILPRLEGS